MYAIVSGASRGIGRSIALQLAAAGYDVVVLYRSRHAEAAQVVAAIEAEGQRAWPLACDVCDRKAMREALTAQIDGYGSPAVVVVNAGITRDGIFALMADEEWDAVLAAGLDGFYNLVRPVIPSMLRARSGRIVCISSVTGQMGNAGQVNYGAAKGGLIAAAKSLAKEVAKRSITVNVVAPGLIDTEMIADLPTERFLPAIPMGRLGRPEEVAAAVEFLVSPPAAYITGQVLGVNGGLYC